MPRHIRSRLGYDQRSGRKVRYGRLVEDGHLTGVFVDRREADREHAQFRPDPVSPDAPLLKAFPPKDANEVRVDLGRSIDTSSTDSRPSVFVVKATLGGYTGTVT